MSLFGDHELDEQLRDVSERYEQRLARRDREALEFERDHSDEAKARRDEDLDKAMLENALKGVYGRESRAMAEELLSGPIAPNRKSLEELRHAISKLRAKGRAD